MLGRFHPRGAGQGHDAGLRRGVVGLPLLRPPADDGRVVDDHAGALRGHQPQRRPGAAEGAVQRHVEHLGPLLVGHVDDGGGAAEAGVVDEHVDPAVSLDRAGEQRLHLLFDRHVAGHREHVAERRSRLAEPALVPVGHDDRRALLDSPSGGGEADARAGRRGHDDDLPSE